jgi:hypothetical protein
LLHLSISVLLTWLTGLRLPVTFHVLLALRIGGTIPLSALASLTLARLLLLAGALVRGFVPVLASLLRSIVGVLVLLITHVMAPVVAGDEGKATATASKTLSLRVF